MDADQAAADNHVALNFDQALRELRVCVATSIHPDYDKRVFRHARSVARMGFSVDLICPWKTGGVGLPRGLSIVPFERAASRWNRLLAHSRMLPLLLKKRYDLFHFHDLDSLLLFATLKTVLRRPVVYDCHENYGEEMLGRAYPIPDWTRRPLAHTVRFCERIAALPIRDIVIVVPRQRETFPPPVFRTTMVRNFADPELEGSRKDDFAGRGSICLSIGSQYVDNGALFLVDVVSAVNRRRPGTKFLVADRYGGDTTLKLEVSRRIDRAGERDHVEFLPNIEAHRVMEHVNRSRVGLALDLEVPRRTAALPTKLFEYMAGGVPIVASDLPYTREFITEARCGVLARPGDAGSFANAICGLLDDPVAAQEMGLRGLAAFRTRLNWNAEAAQLRKVYLDLIGRYRKGEGGR